MNVIRQLSRRTMRTAMKSSATHRVSPTLHSRMVQRNFSPLMKSRPLLMRKANPSPFLMSTRRFSSVFGASVISTFIKTSLVFYGIPITALASPYFCTLPFDVAYGCLLPYHAYVGMAHILTDYAPAYLWCAYVVGGVMFVGLQNLNFQGEGISPMVRRLYTREPLPTTKEEIQQNNWLNKMM